MSLRLVEYSRMRPQPVQVKLQVCSGSSCKTIANFGVLRTLCLMMCAAIFAVSASGNRIILQGLCYRLCQAAWGDRSNRFCILSFFILHQTGQKEAQRRDALGSIDAAAAGSEEQQRRKQRKQEKKPIPFHAASINAELFLATPNSVSATVRGSPQRCLLSTGNNSIRET